MEDKMIDELVDVICAVSERFSKDGVHTEHSKEVKDRFFKEVGPIIEGKTPEEIAEMLQTCLYMNFVIATNAVKADEIKLYMATRMV